MWYVHLTQGKVDTISLGLIVLAAVPWLAPFISSVKVGDLEVENAGVKQSDTAK